MKIPAMPLLLAGLSSSPALAAGTLLIGDSHTVGYFGMQLSRSIQAKRYAVGGTAARHWAQKSICPADKRCPFTYGYATPSGNVQGQPVPPNFAGLEGLIAETKPDFVVIALGTNDAFNGCGNTSGAIGMMRQLLAQLGERRCAWVGPPQYTRGPVKKACGENYTSFVDAMKQAVSSRCQFVDSREVKNPRNGKPVEADAPDQLHFAPELGATWANGVAAKLGK